MISGFQCAKSGHTSDFRKNPPGCQEEAEKEDVTEETWMYGNLMNTDEQCTERRYLSCIDLLSIKDNKVSRLCFCNSMGQQGFTMQCYIDMFETNLKSPSISKPFAYRNSTHICTISGTCRVGSLSNSYFSVSSRHCPNIPFVQHRQRLENNIQHKNECNTKRKFTQCIILTSLNMLNTNGKKYNKMLSYRRETTLQGAL